MKLMGIPDDNSSESACETMNLTNIRGQSQLLVYSTNHAWQDLKTPIQHQQNAFYQLLKVYLCIYLQQLINKIRTKLSSVYNIL